MLKQLEDAAFITDPVGKCLRTEMLVEGNRVKGTTHSDLPRTLRQLDCCLKGPVPRRPLFQDWYSLRISDFALRGDPEKDSSVGNQVEQSVKYWLLHRNGYAFSSHHPVWVDSTRGVIRQDHASGGFAYALLADVEYCLFEKTISNSSDSSRLKTLSAITIRLDLINSRRLFELGMKLSQAITYLTEPADAYILSFDKFPGGPTDAIQRIPDEQAGIYFWFRTFNYPSDEMGFSNALRRDLNAPKFPVRAGHIRPYYEVTVASASQMSARKENALGKALKDVSFRTHIRQLLNHSIILQAPLYIGKSQNIRRRISDHLADDSILSKRLAEHNLDITDTVLLVIPMDDGVNLNLDNMEDEMLYEEIFSRLFNPTFNLRIG